ncbi:MAG: hypothetical protein ACREO4_06650 [Lysobacter sp.]
MLTEARLEDFFAGAFFAAGAFLVAVFFAAGFFAAAFRTADFVAFVAGFLAAGRSSPWPAEGIPAI